MSRPAFSPERWRDENRVCSGAKLAAAEKLEVLVRDFCESSSKYSKRWYNFIFYKSPSLINSSLSLEGVGEEGKDRKICDSYEESILIIFQDLNFIFSLIMTEEHTVRWTAHHLFSLLFFVSNSPLHFFLFFLSNLPADEAFI